MIYTAYEESQQRQTPKAKMITALFMKRIACKCCSNDNIEFVHRTPERSANADALFFRCRFCQTPRKFFLK